MYEPGVWFGCPLDITNVGMKEYTVFVGGVVVLVVVVVEN